MTSDNLTHHPDCIWWHENGGECHCGLTGPAIGNLRPWTKQAMEEWRAKVNAEWQEILGRKNQ